MKVDNKFDWDAKKRQEFVDKYKSYLFSKDSQEWNLKEMSVFLYIVNNFDVKVTLLQENIFDLFFSLLRSTQWVNKPVLQHLSSDLSYIEGKWI